MRRCPVTGKVRHSRKHGLALLQKFNNPALNLYWCPNCRGFHLGNETQNDFRAQARIDQLLATHDRSTRRT